MAMASQQTTSKMTACNLHNARKFSVSVVGIFALLPSVVAWAGFLHNAPCVWYDDTSYSSRKTTSARTLHYCTYSSIHATSYNRRLHNRLTKLQAKEGEIEKAKEKGYQFGDISKSVVKALGTSVNKVTGKDEYQFGDISRWIDKQAKEKVNEFTNKDGEYQFGDISKEIIRRVRTGDFTLDDIVILCKVLISFGVGLQPVASFLPVKLLVEMLNYSIAADLGDKMVGAVATELDKRMKSAITGDEMYRIGDMTLRAVNKFTGKQEYSFGDISKKIMNMSSTSSSNISTSDESSTRVELGSIDEDGVLDVEFVRELEEWDVKTEEIRNKVKESPDYGLAG